MCNNDSSSTALVPYSMKSLADSNCTAAAYMSLNPNLTQAALEHYRLQLYNYASYADRFRYAHPALASHFLAASPYGPPGPHHGLAGHHDMGVFTATLSPYKFDPRGYRVQEEPKPQHSYIGLIGMAILSSPDKKLVLSDIYQYILDNYAYFRSRGPGWRNSIRHNLSLNDCFVKAGRSANGKGHYWAIHPANIEDFKKGDFRRRKAQRRVRKHMGLAVPEDEDSSSPPPPAPPSATAPGRLWGCAADKPDSTTVVRLPPAHLAVSRRRQFDMESLLAPDTPAEKLRLVEDQNSKTLPHVIQEAGEDSFSEGKEKDKQAKDWDEDDIGDSCMSDDAPSPIPTAGLSPEGRPDLCSSTISPQTPSTSQLVSWQKTLLCNNVAAIPLNYTLVAGPGPGYQSVTAVAGGGATEALDRRQHFDRVDQLRRMSMPSV